MLVVKMSRNQFKCVKPISSFSVKKYDANSFLDGTNCSFFVCANVSHGVLSTAQKGDRK